MIWEAIGALGSALAAGVAAWLGVRAVNDQNELREERTRAQAEGVTLVRHSGSSERRLYSHNGSSLPISSTRIVSQGATTAAKKPTALVQPDWGHGVDMDETELGQAVVEFLDAQGLRWARTDKGRLFRLAPVPHGEHAVQYDERTTGSGVAVIGTIRFVELVRRRHKVDVTLEPGGKISRRYRSRFQRWRAAWFTEAE